MPLRERRSLPVVALAISVRVLALSAALTSACKRDDDTILLVHAELNPRGRVPAAITLSVTVSAGTQQSDSHTFMPRSGTPLEFPTSFSLQLPRDIKGPINLTVSALDAAGVVQADGRIERLEIQVGKRQDANIELTCRRGCVPDSPDGGPGDGGMDAPADVGTPGRSCGNGTLDDGELCDPGIAAGRPGACPPANCNDGLACTTDRVAGWGCTRTCEHTPIVTTASGDSCCPAGATAAQDPDCSTSCGNGRVESGETCDTQIPAASAGSCPAPEQPDSCSDDDPCTRDSLISGGTCSAVCAHHPILAPAAGDQCCPPGATGSNDPDCPSVCGNRRKDPGETCDRAAPAGTPDACPTTCQDTDPCTTDLLIGSGCQVECQHLPITRRAGGDLCCPVGATRDLDSDCPARCNNGIVEPGEACDSAIAAGAPGACPAACANPAGACLLSRPEGRAEDCSARCVDDVITLCAPQGDGCCPSGCTAAQDPDCSPGCGNGAVDTGETCDTAVPAGGAGACPTRCNDGNSCTVDRLISPGTCNARCVYSPITQSMSGDGCCPAGGTALLDSDCPAVCGNRLVEPPRETCDQAVPAGSPGACPSACPELPRSCLQPRLTGAPATCNVLCELDAIKACTTGDGCCPDGCDRRTDGDCSPVCGNGVLEAGEVCERGFTAGKPNSCPALCDDYDACTTDVTLGRISDCTRRCVNQRITRCASGDGCCPTGCTADQDADCKATCRNGIIEHGEFCDPPSRCPTTCADDGDPCTATRLRGDPTTCDAHCEHQAILTCSGATADRCCPTSCTAALDVDCAISPITGP